MSDTKIGFIGLGNMGRPMVEQLLNAPYEVTVFNRDRQKEKALIALGAHSAAHPAALAQQTEVIIIMVSDDDAVRAVFQGEEGLFSAGMAGKVIINMSTVSPSVSKEMAVACRNRNCEYLDAPVSGSVKQAETGQLVIMVGGAETAYQKVEPILSVVGKLSKLVGDTGSGNNAKLAINSLLAVYAQGLAETVLFASRQGIQPADLLDLIGNAAIGNIFTKIKGDAILEENYQAAFALKHIVKDLRLAKAEGLSSPLAATALSTFEHAAPKHAEEDIIAVIKALK